MNYTTKNADLYIQRGFVKKLPADAEKQPLNMLFNLNRWFKEQLVRYGVSFNDPCCTPAQTPTPLHTADTLTAAGPVSVETPTTLFVTTKATAYTLADGITGQEKILKMKTDGGDATITVAHLNGGTTITLNDAGDMVKLQYVDNKWYILGNFGALIA